ncbi:small integral membrane protein 30 [Electrophorus electricus]|uniref:small integral membrane protein 30 n=1 Tax=Electrophorus electricus TaxID=8005 RepID=UPI000F0A1D6F|nr:small integral membrane protein 30 [Electrophorus electricus]
MASATKRPTALLMFGLFLATFIQTAQAFDSGDAVALLLGMTLTMVGLCACLGWYARRRSGQL